MTISKLVLFDWNGTFVNDETQTVEAFREVLKGVGDERWKLNFQELIRLHSETFEIPLTKMYEKLGLDLNQAQLAKENLFWKTKYFSLEDSIMPHEGINESVRLINDLGGSFGILSNHVVSAIHEALVRYGYNDTLILANDYDHEAHIEGKMHRLEKYLAEHPDTNLVAIVGDTAEEIEIARNCGVRSIALTNGWSLPEKLEKAKPDFLIDSSNLPKTIQGLLV